MMRIALIADTFPPLRTSGAVQLRDLSREFVRQGHQLTVLLPSSEIADAVGEWRRLDGVQRDAPEGTEAPKTSATCGARLGEFCDAICHAAQLAQRSPLATQKWDGVVGTHRPSSMGPIASALKKASGCKRLPDHPRHLSRVGGGHGADGARAAVSLFRCGGALPVFGGGCDRGADAGEHGVLPFLDAAAGRIGWRCCRTGWASPGRCAEHDRGGRDGAGRAQGVRLRRQHGRGAGHGHPARPGRALRGREDVGFLFVGRGSDAQRLRDDARARGLDNVVFRDEIHPDEIPNLYAQCHIGLVALDPRHRTHNIPGKFLTYMQSGLPVLASVNAGNDLANLIRGERVGQVCESNKLDELLQLATGLLSQVDSDAELPVRCRQLFDRQFSVQQAVRQIVTALSP
jgi:hypothetical protein